MIRETGLTFGRWRQQLHLVVALRELASGAKVQNVATELGYNSVNAFITMFKKALGSTPAQYFAQRGGAAAVGSKTKHGFKHGRAEPTRKEQKNHHRPY